MYLLVSLLSDSSTDDVSESIEWWVLVERCWLERDAMLAAYSNED